MHDKRGIEILSFAADTKRWPRLLRHIPKTGTDTFTMALASLMTNILALALPIALMQIYDRIIPNSSYTTLTWLVIGVLTAIVLETLTKILRSFIGNWLGARLDHILSTEALAHLLHARLDRYEADNPGVHLERFNALNTLKTYISGQLLLVLLDIPFALLYLGLLYYIGGWLMFYTLAILFSFVGIAWISKIRFETQHEQRVTQSQESLDFILETLGGIHTVKALSMEERMFRKFENIQARNAQAGFRSHNWKSLPAILTPFFSQLNMLGVIFLGADVVINGQMTVGAMTACTMLATRSLQPVTRLAGFWLRFSEVTTAQRQLKAVIALNDLENENEKIPTIRDIEGSVYFDDFLMFHDEKDKDTPPFNQMVHAGEVVGVEGEDPRQTRALMLSICGIYKPFRGDIYIDEYNISAMDHAIFGGRVAYLPKKGRLFNGTILENIAMFDPDKRQIALDTAALLEMDGFVADLPNGYETRVDQRSNDSLPLGLIQRTSVARALVTFPRILLIDRTLNSMDMATYDLVCEILEKLKGKTTLFIVSDHGNYPFLPDRIIDCTSREIRFVST